jgi:hypothetical protein
MAGAAVAAAPAAAAHLHAGLKDCKFCNLNIQLLHHSGRCLSTWQVLLLLLLLSLLLLGPFMQVDDTGSYVF